METKCWATGDFGEGDGFFHNHPIKDAGAWACFRNNPFTDGELRRTLWSWYGFTLDIGD